jgi:hypothetical protein
MCFGSEDIARETRIQVHRYTGRQVVTCLRVSLSTYFRVYVLAFFILLIHTYA